MRDQRQHDRPEQVAQVRLWVGRQGQGTDRVGAGAEPGHRPHPHKDQGPDPGGQQPGEQDQRQGRPAQAGGLEFKGNVPHDPLFGRGVGAGLRKEDQQLKAKLDDAIGKLLASEDYKTISARYFDFSVAPRQ